MRISIASLCCLFSLFIGSLLLFTGCEKHDVSRTGKLQINFTYTVDDQPLEFNSLRYTNEAGNEYEVTEVQWFISDFSLTTRTGQTIQMKREGFAHYVDSNIPSTQHWQLMDEIPAGDYTTIKFTFGLKGENNIPGQFPDLPESNMVWPYALGGPQGGYHYMKLNGFWVNTDMQRTPFNFHFGVGQLYNEQQEVTAFVQNWFEVTLPLDFEISANGTRGLELRMNIENWFKDPVVYDHNVYGAMIMKDQEAMGKIRENGVNVFSVHALNNN